MEVDIDVIIAGLFHDVLIQDTNLTLGDIRTEFNENIASLIEEFTYSNVELDEDSENIILIKLADRLHNMRTLEYLDKDKWKEKAKETIAVFSPIAAKLNNGKVTSELNNLAVRYI